jgi:protein-S-isoprenylcysteine O-methyltransferase Ste14
MSLKAASAWLLRNDNTLLGLVLVPVSFNAWFVLAGRVLDCWMYGHAGLFWALSLSAIIGAFSAIFISYAACLLLTAAPAAARLHTALPNMLAILGTFGVYLLSFLSPAVERPLGVYFPLALLAAGSLIVLFALCCLGGSFAVTPQARTLRAGGPYRLVRHPMYVGNMLSLLGLGLLIGTPEAMLVAVAVAGLQIGRASYEERLLLSIFPAYGAYKLQVGGFFPHVEILKSLRATPKVRSLDCRLTDPRGQPVFRLREACTF